MIEFISGDLFGDHRFDALAHGCNCAGAMGRGIAVEFKRRYPEMFRMYKGLCRTGYFSLGDIFAWDHPSGPRVYCLATQKHWRTPAVLDAVESSVHRMVQDASNRAIKSIGIPRIGAGLGRLPWAEVKDVLIRLASEAPLLLTVFEEYSPEVAS